MLLNYFIKIKNVSRVFLFVSLSSEMLRHHSVSKVFLHLGY